MAALYSHTTRTTGTILTATIYNSDHQNHIDNGIPVQLDDYSTNVTQMQLTTDPGEVGAESLAGNLAGELERLRFAIAEIKNRINGGVTPNWYATASGAVSGTTGTFTGDFSALSSGSGLKTTVASGVTQVGTGANLSLGLTDFLNIVSAGTAATKLRWYQNGVSQWSAGLASGSSTWSLSNDDGGGGVRLSVTAAGAVTIAAGLTTTTGGISASSGRLIQSVNNATGFADAGIQAISTAGDVYIAWHASGATAAVLKHARGGAGLELRDSANALTNFLAGPITANSFIPAGSAIPSNGMYLPLANEVGFATNSTNRLVITSDGRLYGTALHNNAGAITGTTTQYIASGTYTPTLTHVLNITASTSQVCQWIRVGNVVTVSGMITIDPTAGSTASQIDISLPIASNLSTAGQLGGTGCVAIAAGVAAAISGNLALDRARYDFTSDSSGANLGHAFTFQYLIA